MLYKATVQSHSTWSGTDLVCALKSKSSCSKCFTKLQYSRIVHGVVLTLSVLLKVSLLTGKVLQSYSKIKPVLNAHSQNDRKLVFKMCDCILVLEIGVSAVYLHSTIMLLTHTNAPV